MKPTIITAIRRPLILLVLQLGILGMAVYTEIEAKGISEKAQRLYDESQQFIELRALHPAQWRCTVDEQTITCQAPNPKRGMPT
jgi:hypothetical protein